jgi:hypothetical protein
VYAERVKRKKANHFLQLGITVLIQIIRTWLMSRLKIDSEAAGSGEWWEGDLLIVLFLGAWALACAAIFEN